LTSTEQNDSRPSETTEDTQRAIPAKKRIAKKKVSAGKKKAVTKKKRAVPSAAPISAQGEQLAQRVTRAQAGAELAQAKVKELRDKVREARAKLKATGDGRAKRTIDSSAEKLGALKEKVTAANAAVAEARTALRDQIRNDAAESSRDGALAAAVEKFKAAWLKDHARKLKLRAKAKKKKPA